jgi:hypothetical protein
MPKYFYYLWLKSLLFTNVSFFPSPNELIENRRNNIDSLIILRDLEVTLDNAIDENTQINDKKAKSIIIGFDFLVAGLILNLIFIIGLILATGYSK